MRIKKPTFNQVGQQRGALHSVSSATVHSLPNMKPKAAPTISTAIPGGIRPVVKVATVAPIAPVSAVLTKGGVGAVPTIGAKKPWTP